MGCALRSYKKRLPADLKDWYYDHKMLMQSKVPTWIDARYKRAITEEKHFLTLPSLELQYKYKSIFWKIRYEGLEGAWYERKEIANRSFDEGKPGWKTDRGYVFMRFGSPQFANYYRDRSTGRAGDIITSVEGGAFLIWEYYIRGGIVRYVFKFRPPNAWRFHYGSLYGMTGQRRHHDLFVKIWGPTPEGWMLWASILKTMMNNKKGENDEF